MLRRLSRIRHYLRTTIAIAIVAIDSEKGADTTPGWFAKRNKSAFVTSCNTA